MENENMLEGTVESIIYHNPENGYCVFTINLKEMGETWITDDADISEELTCTATIPNINEGEILKVTGSFVMHPVYGKQFSVEAYTKSIPTSEQGIEKYLASGVIKGVGAKMAKKIVDKFGADTLEIIENYPEKLAGIRGITMEKAMNISAVFHEQVHLRSAMMFLQGYGISPVYAMKIYKKYKENTVDIVKENPYALADDIIGIGFKTADSIAFRMGIDENSTYRIKSGLKHCLSLAINKGHVYLPKNILISTTAELLNVHAASIADELTVLQMEKAVIMETIDGEICVYLNSLYYAESYVAKKLTEISLNALDKSEGVMKEIEKVECELDIHLADNQKEAVIQSLINGVTVVTGGPGTGKTTTINAIIRLLEREGFEIELAAPTGRAAKRMTETTGHTAKTIHRLLGVKFIDEDTARQSFDKNEEEPVEADVVIIDECSMVDIMLMFNLLKAVGEGTRLILVGDVDQLPSVGPGNVLKDIIQSDVVTVVKLEEIFRQAQQSAIVMNAHRINKGIYPEVNEKNSDFFFVKRMNIDETVQTVVDLAISRLPAFGNYNSFKDIQILTPMRKSPLGVVNLNKVLQQAFNPPTRTKSEYEFRNLIFREGDKVMQIKNNYNMAWRVYGRDRRLEEEGMGVFNGDEGIIEEISINREVLKVVFDEDRVVEYDFSQLDELDLSYAVTIHKSQGSEYKVVIIPVHSGPDMLLNRNLLYTAVTRAREMAVIVGIPETLHRMVDNNRELSRYSALWQKLKKYRSLFADNIF